jgi:hypothetical protein
MGDSSGNQGSTTWLPGQWRQAEDAATIPANVDNNNQNPLPQWLETTTAHQQATRPVVKIPLDLFRTKKVVDLERDREYLKDTYQYFQAFSWQTFVPLDTLNQNEEEEDNFLSLWCEEYNNHRYKLYSEVWLAIKR